VAAQAVARAAVEDRGEGVQVRLSSTIACPDFTARLRYEREVHSLRAGDRELRRLPHGAPVLEPFTWRADRNEIAWCADLPEGEFRIDIR